MSYPALLYLLDSEGRLYPEEQEELRLCLAMAESTEQVCQDAEALIEVLAEDPRPRYVVKVGEAYATGFASQVALDRKRAHVFDSPSEPEYRTAKEWAQSHRDACHPGGRVVRLVSRKRT